MKMKDYNTFIWFHKFQQLLIIIVGRTFRDNIISFSHHWIIQSRWRSSDRRHAEETLVHQTLTWASVQTRWCWHILDPGGLVDSWWWPRTLHWTILLEDRQCSHSLDDNLCSHHQQFEEFSGPGLSFRSTSLPQEHGCCCACLSECKTFFLR